MKKSSQVKSQTQGVKVPVKRISTTRASSANTVAKRTVSAKKTLARKPSHTSPLKIATSGVKKLGKRALKSILLSPTTESAVKVFTVTLLLAGLFYGGYSVASTKFGGDVVISKSEILARVGRVTNLPEGKPEAIVRVQDPESLKKQNPFYSNVSEGDYIVMYPTLAIVYSLKNDRIVSLKKIKTE